MWLCIFVLRSKLFLICQKIYLIIGIVEEDYDSVIVKVYDETVGYGFKAPFRPCSEKTSTLVYDFKGKIRCWDGSELWFR